MHGGPSAAARRRAAGPRAALVAALVLGLLAPLGVPLLPGVATPARAADTDLTLVTNATYTVQPEAGRVRVSVDIVARNHLGETKTRKFYFQHGFLAVPPGSTGFRVSGAKGATVRVARRTKQAILLRIGLGPRLYGGSSRSLRLSFDLPGAGKGASRQVRVGSSLVTFPVWAFASEGARGSRVAVRFPAGWDVAVEAGSFEQEARAEDGGTLLSTGPLDTPLAFFAYVSGQRPATYRELPMAVDLGAGPPAELVLAAWADDPAWAKRVATLFSAALPVLRADIGLDWPRPEPLVVREAASRTGRYAGVFDPGEHLLEVAYWAGDDVILHEAVHAWFNGGLLADRWANEGFASLYAQRAGEALGRPAPGPALTEEPEVAGLPLNAWAPGGDGGAPSDAATEAYGYAAAYALAREISERAGEEGLRRTWQAASARLGAYQPSRADGAGAAPELVDGPPDWRGLLDLLEDGTGESYADLWRRWVVRDGEAALLDRRAEARASYARTLALADGWSLPPEIREALRAWQFEAAEQLMADARTVLAQRAANEQLAAREGLALPATMRARFEAGELREASDLAQAEQAAMLAVAEAADARASVDDPLEEVGMLFEDPEADLAAARAALADGDLGLAAEAADDAERAWTGSWEEGRRRALVALAGLATLVVIGSAAVSRRRRPGPPGGKAGAPVPSDEDPASA